MKSGVAAGSGLVADLTGTHGRIADNSPNPVQSVVAKHPVARHPHLRLGRPRRSSAGDSIASWAKLLAAPTLPDLASEATTSKR